MDMTGLLIVRRLSVLFNYIMEKVTDLGITLGCDFTTLTINTMCNVVTLPINVVHHLANILN